MQLVSIFVPTYEDSYFHSAIKILQMSVPPAVPSLDNKSTWAEKGKLLPLTASPGSRQTKRGNVEGIAPPKGGSGWVQAGLNLPPLAPIRNIQVNLKKLLLNAEQQRLIKTHYENSKNIELLYDINSPHQQESARSSLVEIGLDPASQNALESRWTAQYSVKWGRGMQEQKRTLFQCLCSYHAQARQQRESDKGINRKAEDCERRVPYPFTGCLAHVEITEQVRNGVISRIAGIVEHNSQCQVAVLQRLPPIPLHDHVYEVALEQLRNGASLTAIQETNRKMLEAKMYRGLDLFDPKIANIRYLFLPTDHTSLYRKASKELGYDPRLQPQYNVDDWLNAESRSFRPEIADAVFHYSARAEAGDRFEICISTSEMDECAQKYAHHSQLVLDGTFGVCSSRLLLFIALAVDEDNKGIPIALFLFSAETGAKATHASYNTAILEKLVRAWKLRLETKFGSFEPYSAITDTDTKERGALCWTNHRKKTLRCKAPEFWKNHVRAVLQKLEVDLIATVDYSIATDILVNHQESFNNLKLNLEAQRASEAGLEHIKYLQSYWMSRSLWESWSECGRLAAAARIGIPIEGIIPTTNHLESFNAVLKRKYVARYLRSGHRLRFDALILLLVTRILPQIYHRRNKQREYRSWLSSRFRASAGGQDLLALQQKYHENEKESVRLRCCIGWWPLDEERNQRAIEIVQLQRLHSISRSDSSGVVTYLAQCNPSNSGPTPYQISIGSSGIASCTCTDFHNNGKACKHMRAFRFIIDSWVAEGRVPSSFYYPPTFEIAQNIQQVEKRINEVPVAAVPPAEDFLETDWAMLQAIGGDDTVLGMGFDEEAGEVGANDTDDESVSSDGSYIGVGMIEVSAPQEGITVQITHRLTQEVNFLLPRLYGMENALSDLDSYPPSPELTEFQQVIESLANRLSSLQKCNPSVLSNEGQSSINSTPVSNFLAGKRKRSMLRAPSPEAMQKRKTSNSTI
ncbi:hypothetical protein F5879DRAFT_986170 [Lentinula edodes]|nr:hypothetical protein F5879DRAFT_986170 [Lentinula edodes]